MTHRTVRFKTDTGVQVPSVATDEMREVDRIAIEETGPNLFQMMENAGRNLAMAAVEMLGVGWRDVSMLILAGTGGNGGGGIAAGRHLANRGARVSVLVTDAEALSPVPAKQLEILRYAGGSVLSSPDDVRDPALVIDAVIGYGLHSAPRGIAADFIELANGSGAPVLALDAPSGVDSTSGAAPGAAVAAAVTMTLALPKTGLVGPLIGRLMLADIGIPAEVFARLGRPLDEAIFDDRWVVPLLAT